MKTLLRRVSTSCRRFQEPRVNPVGIQYLSQPLHKAVFPHTDPEAFRHSADPDLLEAAKTHLRNLGLLGKKTQLSPPIDIPHMPELLGSSLDEHFLRLGSRYSQPYLDMAKTYFAGSLPPKPSKWEFVLGWTRYAPDEPPRQVPYPEEDTLVFDVEVLYHISPYPVLATAASSEAWYGWVLPGLVGETPQNFAHLLPLDTHSRPKLLVGYNVSYDRARVLEEYHVTQSKAYFMDAMALHIAISGFCSQQRPLWAKHKKNERAIENKDDEELDMVLDEEESAQGLAQALMEDPWLNKGSPNSLANAAEFHCNIKMDKTVRDYFASTSPQEIVDNFQMLMLYCASDVDATFKVAQCLFPKFTERIPHPVSFAALRLMGQLFLPVTKEWEKYLESAETIYEENRRSVADILCERANELVRHVEDPDVAEPENIHSDPWLRQLDWTPKLPRLRKDGTPIAKQAFLTNYPEWYRGLYRTSKDADGNTVKELTVTVRSRMTPLLLRLKWEGHPLIWTNSAGWCFKVPATDESVDAMLAKNYTKAELSDEDMEILLPELRDNGNAYELFKVPHPEGPKKRCTIIMSKSYSRYFESGVLSSEYEYAEEILKLNATASYWMGNRNRIKDQFVVYADGDGEGDTDSPKAVQFFDKKKDVKANPDMGMIIPKLITMGTVTRRAVENTWLTALNSKANRIGSELKAMVRAPKGYAFVGADVDSEELWIASLMGDSLFKIHGGTALGWMTLEGDKHEKTDLHSKTAGIMGILRNDAKVFNYGRIYGAGVKFATQLLKQCNPSLDDLSAEKFAHELYQQTKGQLGFSKTFRRRLYFGGTESVMFNVLELIAHEDNARTPILGASITDALSQKNLNKNSYMTSRVNWTIQSSGVDYLHLLIVSMQYLIEKYGLDARLMITVHDEVRYMVKEEQKLACALLLQISNLWTRAMFSEQLGLKELPQSCAFFSEVDVDHVLRKEVKTDCVTPSHPDSIGPGESFDINKLLQSFDAEKFLGGSGKRLTGLSKYKFEPRPRIMDTLESDLSDAALKAKLNLQISLSKEEWNANLRKFQATQRQGQAKHVVFEPVVDKADKKLKPAFSARRNTSAKKAERIKREDELLLRRRKQVLEEYTLVGNGDELLQEEMQRAGAETRAQKAEQKSPSGKETTKKTTATRAPVRVLVGRPWTKKESGAPRPMKVVAKKPTNGAVQVPSTVLDTPKLEQAITGAGSKTPDTQAAGDAVSDNSLRKSASPIPIIGGSEDTGLVGDARDRRRGEQMRFSPFDASGRRRA